MNNIFYSLEISDDLIELSAHKAMKAKKRRTALIAAKLAGIAAVVAAVCFAAPSGIRLYHRLADRGTESSVGAASAGNESSVIDTSRTRINLTSTVKYPSLNLKSPVPGKICCVEDTDTLFYSDNSGLYQKNGDTVIKLSPRPAMAINLYNGRLYYIAHGDDLRYPSGRVWCLDLSDGSEKCLIDEENISNISVSGDTIYYVRQSVSELEYGAKEVMQEQMKCDLNGENRSKNTYGTLILGDDMYASRGAGGKLDLRNAETSELLFSEESYSLTSNVCRCGDSVYYIVFDSRTLMNVLHEVNFSDNSITEKSYDSLKGNNVYVDDYTVFNGKVYICGGDLWEMSDKAVRYEGPHAYLSVYSGDRLYALKQDGSLCALELTEEDGVNKIAETDID